MFPKMFLEKSFLPPNIRRVDSVEHGEYEPPAVAYLGKFLEAPLRRRVVRGDDDDGSRRVLDCLDQTQGDLVSTALTRRRRGRLGRHGCGGRCRGCWWRCGVCLRLWSSGTRPTEAWKLPELMEYCKRHRRPPFFMCCVHDFWGTSYLVIYSWAMFSSPQVCSIIHYQKKKKKKKRERARGFVPLFIKIKKIKGVYH